MAPLVCVATQERNSYCIKVGSCQNGQDVNPSLHLSFLHCKWGSRIQTLYGCHMRQAPKTSIRTKDCCEFEVACDQDHLFWPLLRLSYPQLCNFKQSWNLFFSFTQWLSSESLPCGRRCAQKQRQVLLPVVVCRLVCVIDYVLSIDGRLCPTLYYTLCIHYP